MPRQRNERGGKPKEPGPKNLPFHAFWSGSLSFELVNVPVLVFPGHPGIRESG